MLWACLRLASELIFGNLRVLTKGVSAEVQIVLRSTSLSSSAPALPIPLEPFSVNKDMGRILLRRGGETIGAGKGQERLTLPRLLTNIEQVSSWRFSDR